MKNSQFTRMRFHVLIQIVTISFLLSGCHPAIQHDKLYEKRELLLDLESRDYYANNRAIKKLVALKHEAVPELIDMLRSGTYRARQGARQCLQKIGPDALPDLVAAYADADAQLRYEILSVMNPVYGRMGEKPILQQTIPFMRRGLMDRSSSVRCAAALGLGELDALDDQSTIEALLSALDDKDMSVKLCSARALSRISPDQPKLLSCLQELLCSPNIPDFEIALWAICQLGPRAEPLVAGLILLLEANNFKDKITVARALGNIGSAAKSAIPQLRALVDYGYPAEQMTAREAINKISHE